MGLGRGELWSNAIATRIVRNTRMTVWKAIPSWPGYEASSDGEIRLTIQRRSRKPRILKGGLHSNGYRSVQTTFNGKKVLALVHRLVCEAFHGPAPSRVHEVRHLDGQRSNNKPSNLKWGTGKENAADRRRHRRDRLGARHHCAKIDDHEVIAIFCLARRGYTGDEIADLFGLDRNQINKIVARSSWKHVHVPRVLLAAAEARNEINGADIPSHKLFGQGENHA